MSVSSVDWLYDGIKEALETYEKEVSEKVNSTVDIVAKEVNKEIKSKIMFKQPTGKYVKNFRIDKTYDKKHKRVRTWYVGNGYHRLTHLLEHGHQMPQGGRARAYPHIKYGEELAVRRMEEIIRGVIDD